MTTLAYTGTVLPSTSPVQVVAIFPVPFNGGTYGPGRGGTSIATAIQFLWGGLPGS